MRKVQPGDRWRPNAAMHNDTVDVIDAFKKGRMTVPRNNVRPSGSPITAYVVNKTGRSLAARCVVGVDGEPSDFHRETETAADIAARTLTWNGYPEDIDPHPPLIGETYDKETHKQRIAVIADAVGTDATVEAYTSGNVWVYCYQATGQVHFVEPDPQRYVMKPCQSGGWRVLAQTKRPTSPENIWVMINLDDQPGHDTILVQAVSSISGSTYSSSNSGSSSGPCVTVGGGLVRHVAITGESVGSKTVEPVMLNGDEVTEQMNNLREEGYNCGQLMLATRDMFGDLQLAEVYGFCDDVCPDGSSGGSGGSGTSGSGSGSQGIGCTFYETDIYCNNNKLYITKTPITLVIRNGRIECERGQDYQLFPPCDLCCDGSSSSGSSVTPSSSSSGGGGDCTMTTCGYTAVVDGGMLVWELNPIGCPEGCECPPPPPWDPSFAGEGWSIPCQPVGGGPIP